MYKRQGISLLSIAGKVLAKIIISRLTDNLLDSVVSESQRGLRANRGTVDMIFATRQLQEKCREQNQNLYMMFVDLTKAFETVNRERPLVNPSKIRLSRKVHIHHK